jgi:hypothetical protein
MCPSLWITALPLRVAGLRCLSLCLADALCRRPEPARGEAALALTATRHLPARVTRSSTSVEVEDRQAAHAYFFFRRFVFFAPFFAAAFAFDFLFFAIAALLAVLGWRCQFSARANREHCIPITTAAQKNQRLT